MTTTSIITVTPNTVWVNGPLALNSFTMAIAEEGHLATIMAPARIETAILADIGMVFMNGIKPESKKKVRLVKENVQTTRPVVTQAMLFTLVLSSFK